MQTIRTIKISALAALAAAAAAASASTATAATISPAHVRFPQATVNARGTTVVAWERLTRGSFAIEARLGATARNLGRTYRLSRAGYGAQVAVGTDGTAAVMWLESPSRRPRAIRVAVARPGHGFGKSQIVERHRASMLAVGLAVQPNGRVVAVWQRSAGQLAYALAARKHAFGTARDLTASGSLASPSIALDQRDGAVVVAYGTPLRLSPPRNSEAAVRTLAPSASAFSAETLLSSVGISGEAYPIAVSGPAGAGVAFRISGGAPSLQLSRRAADGSWSAAGLIATTDFGEDISAQQLRATLPSDGSAIAAWSIVTERPGGLGDVRSSQVVTSIAPAADPFGAPQPFTSAAGPMKFLAVAAAGGEAFVATANPRGSVLLATRAPGATTFGTAATLASKADGDIVLAAGGKHVIALYQRSDRLRLKVLR